MYVYKTFLIFFYIVMYSGVESVCDVTHDNIMVSEFRLSSSLQLDVMLGVLELIQLRLKKFRQP